MSFPGISSTTLTTRKTIQGVLIILAVIVLFILLFLFRLEVIQICTGIVLSISLTPVVDWLRQHGLSRNLSMILIYVCVLIGILVFIFLVIPQIIQEVTLLLPRIENFYLGFREDLQNSPYNFIRQWVNNLPGSTNLIFVPDSTHLDGEKILNSLNWTLNAANSILNGLFTVSIVLLIGFYWTIEGERVEYSISLLVPIEKREKTRGIIKEIETRVGGFVRGQGFLALVIGILSLGAYFMIGLPSFLSLAFLAAMCEFIPVFGPTLGAIPAILVALESNPTKVLWVIVATVLIQFLENHLLAPRVMQKTVGVNPIVTILSIIGFGSVFGFSGLLMAIPLAAIVQVILDQFLLHPDDNDTPVLKAPAGRDGLSKLSYEAHEFVQDIRKLVRRKETGTTIDNEDEIEDAMESIAIELDELLAQASPAEPF